MISAGELTLDMLEIGRDAGTGFSIAPPHIQANNGLYLIDDLGRQRMPPQALFNRWIIPLDRGSDTFALPSGGRVTLPFDAQIAFASNLSPDQLGDDAFVRRLGCKLHIGALSIDEYRELFTQQCNLQGIHSNDAAFDFLIHDLHLPSGQPLLACYPRDLLNLVSAFAKYYDETAVVNPDALTRAWHSYFSQPEGDVK